MRAAPPRGRRWATPILLPALAVAALLVPGVPASAMVELPTAAAAPSFTLGTVLPDTGSLRAYGPATQAAVALAVEDANAAGGVMGSPITLAPGDSGQSGDGVFARELDRLASAQAIIGPLSSQLVLDNLAAIEGRTLVSPATSSPLLSGRLARVVPTDELQGAVLAMMAQRARSTRLVVVGHRDDRATIQAAIDRGRASDLQVISVVYGRRDPARIASSIVRSRADALALISASETTAILKALLPRGMPATVLLTEQAAEAVAPRQLRRGTLRGAQSLERDLRVPDELKSRIRAMAPGARETAYSPQAYDAAAVAILAAEQTGRATGSITPQGVRGSLPAVTSGGSACDTLERCLRLIGQGVDIEYVGYTGPVALDSQGDAQGARYLARTYTADNTPGRGARVVRYP